jgi:hypothetical protein
MTRENAVPARFSQPRHPPVARKSGKRQRRSKSPATKTRPAGITANLTANISEFAVSRPLQPQRPERPKIKHPAARGERRAQCFNIVKWVTDLIEKVQPHKTLRSRPAPLAFRQDVRETKQSKGPGACAQNTISET